MRSVGMGALFARYAGHTSSLSGPDRTASLIFLSVTRHVGRMSEGDRTADGAPSGDTAPEEAQTNEGRLGRPLVSARADPLPECAPEVAVRPRARSGDPVPEYDP